MISLQAAAVGRSFRDCKERGGVRSARCLRVSPIHHRKGCDTEEGAGGNARLESCIGALSQNLCACLCDTTQNRIYCSVGEPAEGSLPKNQNLPRLPAAAVGRQPVRVQRRSRVGDPTITTCNNVGSNDRQNTSTGWRVRAPCHRGRARSK